jgi:hypothetical protein
MRSYNPQSASTWVWAVPISLAATFGISVIYFPPGTEMVHFPGLAHTRLCIQRAVTRVHLAGFPHSEILGSKPACGSPRLIAACHVLHRLLAPRHPPYALSSLIIKLTQSVSSFRSKSLWLEKLDVLIHVAPYILASAFRNPGRVSRNAFHPFRGFRKLTQAFVSTILKQLTEPPFFHSCSTRANL